jgi:hypothetical protein
VKATRETPESPPKRIKRKESTGNSVENPLVIDESDDDEKDTGGEPPITEAFRSRASQCIIGTKRLGRVEITWPSSADAEAETGEVHIATPNDYSLGIRVHDITLCSLNDSFEHALLFLKLQPESPVLKQFEEE